MAILDQIFGGGVSGEYDPLMAFILGGQDMPPPEPMPKPQMVNVGMGPMGRSIEIPPDNPFKGASTVESGMVTTGPGGPPSLVPRFQTQVEPQMPSLVPPGFSNPRQMEPVFDGSPAQGGGRGLPPQVAPRPVSRAAPSMLDYFTAFAQGQSGKGDLLTGISAALNAGGTQDRQRRNIEALTQKGLSPQIAQTIAENPDLMKAVIPKLFSKQLGGLDLSKTPIYGTKPGPNGTRVPAIAQLSSDGNTALSQMPEGFEPSTGFEKVDLGDSYLFKDKRSGRELGIVQKNLRDAEREKAAGAGEGKAEAERPIRFRKAQQTMTALDHKSSTVSQDLTRAIDLIETSGIPLTGVFSYANAVRGTPMYDLAKLLEGVKANVGFDELQQMRDNSPTGGALGQVTEREIAFLQALRGSMDEGQRAGQLLFNLKRIRDGIASTQGDRVAAFQSEFGDLIQEQQASGNAPAPSVGMQVGGDQIGGLPDGTIVRDANGGRFQIKGGHPVPIQ